MNQLLTYEKFKFDEEEYSYSKTSTEDDRDSKNFPSSEYVYPINCLILTIDEFNTCNFNKEKRRASSEIVTQTNKVTKFSLPHEKRMYWNWSVKKLEDEIKNISNKIEEMKCNNQDDDKKEKEIKHFNMLTNKWLKISQDAVGQMLEMFPQNKSNEKNTIKNVLDYFKIEYEMIKYDEEEDCFKE